jgi:sugar phosphate isomerase/epimerase
MLNRRQLLKRAAQAAGLGAATALFPRTDGRSEESKMPHFKYAICNETFGTWPFEKAFALVAECGYRGIEIAPFTIAQYVTEISASRRGEVRRQAEQAGLDVVGLHWLLAKTQGFHLTGSDPAVRRKTAEYLGNLARFCADLGGRIMVLGSPQQRNLAPGMTAEQGMQNAADVLRAALPTLERSNVTVALEPLAPAETNFLTTAAQAVGLIELVGSPHCRLHLDCKAMAAETTPIPALIERYRNLLVHFHANDPNRQGPGFGKLEFTPIMKALGGIDYRGWVSVEVFDYSPGAERLARESIAYLRKCAAAAD